MRCLPSFAQCWVLQITCLITLAGLAPISSSLAQEALPDSWQELSAPEFIDIVESLLTSEESPTSEQFQEMATHAWTRFLSDEAFLQSGEISVVLRMLGTFRRTRPDSVTNETIDTVRRLTEARLTEGSEGLRGMDLYILGNATKSLNRLGSSALENAPAFVRWMENNDWKALETQHLYNLFGFVNPDSLNRKTFSARWAGTLTPSQTGDYVFRQARVYLGKDSKIKLWIGDTLVVDSSSGEDVAFTSSPIRLTGQEPVPLRAELIHDVDEIEYGVSTPMALITWKTPKAQNETIIPSANLAPPQGFGEPGAKGLRGEYFADTGFSELKVTRLDPTLDLIWSWPPTAPAETEAAREVFTEIVSRLHDDAYMNRIAGEDDETIAIEFDRNLWRVAYRMSGTERLELIDVLRRNPRVLARLSLEAVGRLMRGFYMLPGTEHLHLLGEWSMARPQPRCLAGWFPGWGNGSYQKLNTDFYWAMGHMLQGPYGEAIDKLSNGYLVRENGECNLAVAYAIAYAAAETNRKGWLLDLVQQQIDSETSGGDQKATWLIAKAFIEGAIPGEPEPLSGWSSLEEAFLIADTEAYRFWALEEMVARLSSVNKGERAKALIEAHRDQFKAQEYQLAMANWIEKADGLAERYIVVQEDKAKEKLQSYRAELKHRQKDATPAEAKRINEILESLSNSDTIQE